MNHSLRKLMSDYSKSLYLSYKLMLFFSFIGLSIFSYTNVEDLQQLAMTLNALKERSSQLSPISKSPAFDELYEICIVEPYYKDNPKPSTTQYISEDELNKTIQEFIKVNTTLLMQEDNWLKKPPSIEDITSLQSLNHIPPFLQKLVVDPNTEIAFHGDIHGDKLSLAKYIKSLQTLGYMNGFKILNPEKFYLVFLGDYVDNGNDGILVLYILMRLKIENPHNVIILKGSHEHPLQNQVHGFQDEFNIKQYSESLWHNIISVYDLFPVALYLGSGSRPIINYLLCVHGGLENPRNVPKSIISFNKKEAFAWLKKSVINIPSGVGYMWNFFNIDPAIPKADIAKGKGVYSLSKDDTIKYLKNFSSLSTGNILKGVFRAHQNSRGDMLELIKQGSGLSKLWPEKHYPLNKLWDDIVITFAVSPDTSHGKTANLDYDAFGILKTANNYDDWKLNLYNNINIYDKKLTTIQITEYPKRDDKEDNDSRPGEKVSSLISLSFAEWYEKCKALPFFRKIGQNFDHKAIEWEDLDKTIDEFVAVNTKLLQESDKWIEDAPHTSDEFFTQLQAPLHPIKPFVQKLVVNPQTTIAFHGDFHGDIHSMIEYIKRLNIEKHMNGFAIKDPNFYLVFLGDYEDRGNYGAEVWYTLMRLKITNPQNVFIVRGNHEDEAVTALFGFSEEFCMKFEPEIKTKLETIQKQKNVLTHGQMLSLKMPLYRDSQRLKKFQRIFDFLPTALYLGAGTETSKNYLLCIHGGLEKNFNPASLLSSTRPLLYEWLKFSTTQSFPTKLGKIGFLWNDFHVTPEEETSYQEGRGYQYNKEDTVRYFREQSNRQDGYVIKGIFRAHQHSGDPEDPLMQAMLNGKGVAKLWPNIHNPGNLWDDIVCTFLVGADTAYGKIHRYNWDGFGILTTAEKFEDWKLEMLVNDIVPTDLR